MTMKQEGLVSVVIPAYNAVPYIEACVQSVLSQVYQQIEVIIVDDGSSDETLMVCERFQQMDSRVRVYHQENSGPSCARNWGMTKVSGEFLLFIDADDYLEPNAVSTLVEKMQSSKADVCCFAWRDVGVEEKIHTYTQEEMHIPKEKVIRNILFDDFLNGGGFLWNKIWRISAVASAGEIPQFDVELTKYEDKLWVLESLNVCRTIVSVNEPQYNCRLRENSLSHKSEGIRTARMNYEATVKMLAFVRKSIPEMLHEAERWSQGCLAGLLYRGVREKTLTEEDRMAAKAYPIWMLPKGRKQAIHWILAKLAIQCGVAGGKGL